MLVKVGGFYFVMRKSCHIISIEYSRARSQIPPLELPVSIKELALRPRSPKLLLLSPLPLFPSRIALFRLITGVSANGSAIFVAE